MSGFSDFEWMDQAACLDADPDMFFPEKKGRGNTAEAELFCAPCPVQTKCAQFRRNTASAFGVWGGTTIRSKSAGISSAGPRPQKKAVGA